MNRSLFLLGAAALGVVACGNEAPDPARLLTGPPLTARGGGAQTPYGITLLGGLQNDPARPFSSMGKTGDPFSAKISADPAYLVLPSAGGGDPAVCNQDGSGTLPSTGTWDGYVGVWKGSFEVTGRTNGSSYHVAYNATREDGTGRLWLVVNGTAVKSNNKLTLSFTNVRGLVGAGSTPDGGPYDPQDRCLTFSVTATP